MERQILLLEGEARRGALLCRDEGCYLLCTVDAAVWEGGVKKVWLCGEGGGRLLLGTLVPENGRFHLRRRISHSSLRCCGVTPPFRALVNPGPEGSAWHSLSSLRQVNPALLQALRAWPEGLWRWEEGRLLLRFPWRQGEAVPLMHLFCFGQGQDGWWEVEVPEQAQR